MKLQLIALALTWLTTLVSGQSKTCNLKEFDMCLTNFYYDHKAVPVNERQFRKACNGGRTLHRW